MKVAIVGGGAAGFFAAITCKEHHPDAHIVILEKTSKVLSKVKVSGGGRCNVTHDCQYPSDLVKKYPRGGRQLKKHFKAFNNHHIIDWFKSQGVELKVESDGRMFPTTDNSQTIIDCFLSQIDQHNIPLRLKAKVLNLEAVGQGIELTYNEHVKEVFDKVIIATGGSNQIKNYQWLQDIGHDIVAPIPSLFTFNMPDELIIKLMGVTVPSVSVSIIGSKYSSEGPLLITHWGMSGPAILTLSAWAARYLYDAKYHFEIAINWCGALGESDIKELLNQADNSYIKNYNPFNLPQRLWSHLLTKADIDHQSIWRDINKKAKNKLAHLLFYDTYQVNGKTTFKEEFVTCGGISWHSIDQSSMASKAVDGLYFAGEILDVDGVTGGFNFQAAWTTAWVASKLL